MGGCVESQANQSSISKPKMKQDAIQYKPPPAKNILYQTDPRASFAPPTKKEQMFQNAEVEIQSAPVLSSDQQQLFNQQPSNPALDKKELLKNIDFINFQIQGSNMQYYGEVKVTNPATSIISWEEVTIMGSSKYGKGRVVAFGSEIVWKESNLKKNKSSVFLLRNTFRWVTKEKKNSQQTPYRAAMIGINQLYSYSLYLQLADTFVDFTFISDISSVQLASYDVIIIGDLFFDSFKGEDAQILQNYVRNGGGIITSFKTWVWTSYGQGKNCKNWRKQCLHNIIFGPMGIQFGDDHAPLKNLTFKCNEKMQIKKLVKRQYIKNSNNQSSQLLSDLKEEEKILFVKDYNIIVDGIQTLEYGGAVASSFSCPEDLFFPIIQVEGYALMTAGFFGSGKLLLFGHPAIFTHTADSNIKLLTNTLKWMCGEKSSYNIGLFINSSWEDLVLENAPIQTRFQTVVSQDQIASQDVIFINYFDSWPQQLNTDMIQTLKSYVQNGGNIIFGSHGWVWAYYGEGSRDKSLKYDSSFASGVILKQFDIYLEQNFYDIPKPAYSLKKFEDSQDEAGSKNYAIENFLKNDLLKVLKGAKSFKSSDSQISQHLSIIKSGENFNKICSIDIYHEIVDAFVNSSFNIEKNYDTIPGNNKFYNTVYDIMNSLSYSCPPEQCRALPPSLNKYPGYATKKIAKKVVKVYKNRNKRVYIGLYVNPGEAIGIKHSNNTKNISDIQLKLNHNLDLTDRDNGNLKRFPNISRVIKIKSKQFLFASPHGGLLFFQINEKSQSSEPLQFQFYGAYEAPYFNQELHSAKDFKNIQKIDAPFFVFETKRVVIVGPTKKIFRSLDIHVQKMCNYWNGVINTIKEFRGSEPYPFEKDSIFNDIQLIMGYMHSGNPVHTHEDVTYQFLGCGKDITKLGNWGIYHQFGHNHQDYKWTTNGLVQVTNNICSLYCFWKIHNQSVFKSRWLMSDPKQILQKFNKHIALPESQKMANYDEDPALGLYLFAIIIDEFSFEVFKNLHRQYDKMDFNPNNDEQRYENLAEQLSLVTGYNMWPYLKKWGFPITASSQGKVSHLKKYKCKRHPNLTP